MQGKRTYKQKNRGLLFGAIAFAVLAYAVSIQRTVSLYGETRRLEGQLHNLQQAPATLARLTRELEGLEAPLSRFSASGTDWEERLLNEVARVCQAHGVTLIQLPPPQVEEQSRYALFTRVVKLRGGYRSLVHAIHALEGRKAMGRINSVRFALESDRDTRASVLFAYVYIQHIEKGGTHGS